MNIFLKYYNTIVSSTPTTVIVLLNIGFTGSQGSIDPEQLLQFLKSFTYKRSLMPPRPFCFIEFSSIKDSETAFAFIQQSTFFDRKITLEYLIKIPEIFDHNVLCDPQEIQNIPGLIYFPDFITDKEEECLLHEIKQIDSWIALNHRQVKHYGYSYDYVNEGSTKVEPFPDWISQVFYRIQDNFPQFTGLNQLTINSYQPGDGIGPHSDSTTIFGTDPIIVVSLSSSIVMDFIIGKNKQHVDVGRKSLLIMSQEARLDWQHGIRNRKIDYVNGLLRKRGTRISLTFRKVAVL